MSSTIASLPFGTVAAVTTIAVLVFTVCAYRRRASLRQHHGKSDADSSSVVVSETAHESKCEQKNEPTRVIKQLPFSHKHVVAPMVDQSDLAFRMLCRKHGADLCYTQMLYSDKFAESSEYRKEFTTCKEDRPLAVQFAANNAATLLTAAKFVESCADAVDINLGCPQQRAYDGRFGSYLLDREHWPLIRSMVRNLAHNLKIPVFCKVRLLPTLRESIELCTMLEESGCALIAVHGRQRGSPKRRREGPANLEWIRRIALAVGIPVISNGNVRSFSDVRHNERVTGAAGIMSAEAVLENPALFSGRADAPDPFVMCDEYLESCHKYGPPPLRWIQDHIKNICRPLLRDKLDLKQSLRESTTSVDDIRRWIQTLRSRCGRSADVGAAVEFKAAATTPLKSQESKAISGSADEDADVSSLFG